AADAAQPHRVDQRRGRVVPPGRLGIACVHRLPAQGHMAESVPVLTLITFLPAAAGLLLSPLKAEKGAIVRWVALGVSLVVLGLAAWTWAHFDPSAQDIQFREHALWVPLSVPIHYTMGLDGISLALVALTAFLMPLAIRASWHQSNGFIITLLFLRSEEHTSEL